jgi:hypothetical protein
VSFVGKTRIYALRDGHWIRYVGKTKHPLEKRLSGHLVDARNGNKTYKCNWIRSMLLRGQIPRITLLEEVDGDGCKDEIAWIKFFRDGGVDLVNGTDGGEGGTGHKCSAESCRRISEGHMGQVAWNKGKRGCFSETTIKKMRDAKEGIPLSPIHRVNISKSLKGHKAWGNTEESRRKISASLMGKHPSEETRAKLKRQPNGKRLFGMEGKKHSLTTILKLSKARKGIPWTKERRDAQNRRGCV